MTLACLRDLRGITNTIRVHTGITNDAFDIFLLGVGSVAAIGITTGAVGGIFIAVVGLLEDGLRATSLSN